MSTSYGFACPEHRAQTSGYLAQQDTGRQSLAAMWRFRDLLARWHADVEPALLETQRWYGFASAGDAAVAEAFVVAHAACPVEIVNEYGDRELPDDVMDERAEPDADDVVRRVLSLLGFPADAIQRTTAAIVDAMDAQRLLSWRRRPARISGGAPPDRWEPIAWRRADPNGGWVQYRALGDVPTATLQNGDTFTFTTTVELTQ